MAQREESSVKVTVDGQSAEDVIKKLDERSKSLNNQLNEMRKNNDKLGFDKVKKELKDVEAEMKAYRKSTFDVSQVMNNLSKTSINDLRKAKNMLNGELNKMTRGTAEYIAKSKQLDSVTREYNSAKSAINGVNKELEKGSGFTDALNIKTLSLGAAFGGMISNMASGAWSKAQQYASESIDLFVKNQEKLSELSSITGLEGDNLEWLKETASELSESTLENGIKITKGANEIIDAYKLMGSAKPELLKDKEALNEVTKQALILAEAAKMDTAPAVESLANTMNQFGAGSDQAARYINVLAAGSLEGAASIEEISNSIIKFGPAAASANVSIEESVALIEALADKGVKGEVAGTALRGVLLKLQTGADEFNPKIVGMNQALENLKAANLSAADVVKMFGQENFTAASILIENTKRVNELETAVSNTDTAIVQATRNTSNYAAEMKQLENEAENLKIEVGEKLTPITTWWSMEWNKYLGNTLDLFNGVTEAAKRLFSQEERNKALASMSAKEREEYFRNHMAFMSEEQKIEYANSFLKTQAVAVNDKQTKSLNDLTKARSEEKKAIEDSNVELETKNILSEEELAAQKKYSEEYAKSREELLNYIKKLNSEAVTDKIEKLLIERKADLEYIQSLKGTAIEKQMAMDLAIQKWQNQIDAAAKESQLQKLGKINRDPRVEAEKKITELFKDELKNRDDQDEEYSKKMAKRMEDLIAKEKELQTQVVSIGQEMGTAVGALLLDTISNSEKAMDNFGKNMILIALKFLKKQIEMLYVEITARSVAQLGPVAGAIAAGASIAVIEGAFAVAQSSVTQNYEGRYPVIGVQDGQKYNANYTGSVKTGYYSQPTLGLFGEKGAEIVIDGNTTKKLQLNRPDIINYIYKTAGVNQYADGNYPATTLEASGNDFSKLESVLSLLEMRLRTPLTAEISWSKFLESEQKYNNVITSVSR